MAEMMVVIVVAWMAVLMVAKREMPLVETTAYLRVATMEKSLVEIV